MFGKRHDNVLRAIAGLDISNNLKDLNFEVLEITEKNVTSGATYKRKWFQMTRDGFTMLAMGFTGKKAAQFKEAYIHEFNQMEAFILENQKGVHAALPDFTNPAIAARAWAEEYEGCLLTN